MTTIVVDDIYGCQLRPVHRMDLAAAYFVVKGFGNRVELLLTLLGKPGKPISKRELARRCGFETDSQISVLIARGKEADAQGEEPSVESKVLLKIARGSGCNISWLITGEGDPMAEPSIMGAAVAAAKASGATDADVTFFLQTSGTPERITSLNAVEIAHLILEARRARLGDDGEDDEVPSRPS